MPSGVYKLAGNWVVMAYGSGIGLDWNGLGGVRDFTRPWMTAWVPSMATYTTVYSTAHVDAAQGRRHSPRPPSNGQSRSQCEQRMESGEVDGPVGPSVSQWGSRCSSIINSTWPTADYLNGLYWRPVWMQLARPRSSRTGSLVGDLTPCERRARGMREAWRMEMPLCS